MASDNKFDMDTNKYSGIGGWLAFFSITLLVTPFRLLSTLVGEYIPFIKSAVFIQMKTPGSGIYNPYWMPWIAFEVASSIAFLIFLIMLNIRFYQRKRFFPKIVTTYFHTTIIYNIISVSVIYFILNCGQDYKIRSAATTLAALGVSIVWIVYFRVSKRVKCTFINE